MTLLRVEQKHLKHLKQLGIPEQVALEAMKVAAQKEVDVAQKSLSRIQEEIDKAYSVKLKCVN